ncbi:SGNH/GDSL hydrolase family protein [Mucilaginibacter phyllosphaerae]|uniref:Lysophospholipase L1-like esterase n=1 Tax=Mucilaginibacter phyllosphaerae TaxID=1812349 RepID=A0A4Y8AA19_9SPHI|nr:SGNH/GDSL hydrolase family protein [Mucilaginibacter phyllosphaerae]MBB3969928.1 lysophospholipase L1-like esterase [Mucilaginibacter phyllosphaerae]TEW65300.1 SGNH/GDSL hydrolase family protein [Mucilaginibacter phyllosphaerae]GGH16746.1 lysophospholipase [Mucilaginibacter phyllosphaerae]
MRLLTAIVLISTLAACTKAAGPVATTVVIPKKSNMPSSNSLTYLALGDSYTIGEAVTQDQSFPYQLAARLTAAGRSVTSPDIIAVTGWTTADLKQGIISRNLQNKNYSIVTLLIGVNNQYRGYSKDVYRKEFVELLNTAIGYAGGNIKHVFVISIPDWGVTPFAKNSGRDAAQVGADIDRFNAINKQETEKLNVNYIDITPASRRAADETGLIADDGLHPSGNMYSLWVNQLLPAVDEQVK